MSLYTVQGLFRHNHCSKSLSVTNTSYYPVISHTLLHRHTAYTLYNVFTLTYLHIIIFKQLTCIIIQFTLNNALPFNQPWGALNYKIYSGGTVYIYIGAHPNVMQCYLYF